MDSKFIRTFITLLALAGILSATVGCSRFYDNRGRSESPAANTNAPRPNATRTGGDFVPVPAPGAKPIPVPASGIHKVVRGNTVYSISRLYGVPVRSIIEANRLKPPYLLKVGDRIRISAPRTHKVARGETVYSISRRYSVEMNALTRANGIRPPYTISVGQQLTIPSGAGGDAKQVASNHPVPRAVTATPPTAQPVAKKPTPKQVAALPNPPARTGKLFAWPLSGKLISRFGSQSGGRHNDGINISAKRGATVVAAENGVVAYAGNELRGFGNLLLIKHADGYMTAYAHNEALLVTRGQKVTRGQAIARVGSSGSVGAPQLHFEIRKGRKAIDPLRHLPKAGASS